MTADFLAARILAPLAMSYDTTVKKFDLFDKIINPLPEMRADVMKLVEIAIKSRKIACLLINNRAEGCAPQTIVELQKIIEELYKNLLN